MIPKWEHFCIPIFFDNNTDWEKKAFLVQDCKHIKNFLLQRHLKKFIEIVHGCTVADKASYIEDNFWIWDNRVEYEWTPERINITESYMLQSCAVSPNHISDSIPFFDNVRKKKCGKLQSVERLYRLRLEASNKTEVITMDNKNAVVVRRDWVEVALNIIRFFFQHSTVEIDGMNRKAKIKYHGPNG